MAAHTYTCTLVENSFYLSGEDLDYGMATLTIIPDGSHPLDRPETLKVRVPLNYRPGKEWKITIEELS